MASFRRKGRIWYFRYTDANGDRRERRGCLDRRATERLAHHAEEEAAKVREGLIDPQLLALLEQEARPLADHLAAYREVLIDRGNVPRYVHIVNGHVARIVGLIRGGRLDEIDPPARTKRKDRERAARTLAKLLRDARITDLSAEAVQRALGTLRRSGLSAQTCNHALRAAKGFTNWARENKRASEDRLADLKGFNIKEDRRHDRGVLSAAEFKALLAAAADGRPFRRITGEDRVLLYLTAAYTGLRASELASLLPAGFDFDELTVSVRAGYTKNGEPATLPLRPDLAELLRAYLADRPADALVWPGTWHEKGAEMLRADLERAGVPYVDDDGRYRDFHSLRHRFGTELAIANVPPKVIQTLMRHSTITLTMDRYSHASLFHTAGAVEKLPPIPSTGHRTEPSALLATGTDGRPISDPFSPHLPRAVGGKGRSGAESGGMAGESPLPRGATQPLESSGAGASRRGLAVGGGKYTRQDSNLQPSVPKSDARYEQVQDSQDVASHQPSPFPRSAHRRLSEDPDLVLIVESWPALSTEVRACMLAMVRASRRKG